MLFVVDHKSDRVKKYELDSAYTITAGSTISSTQQSAQSEDTNTRGLGISPDGLITVSYTHLTLPTSELV